MDQNPVSLSLLNVVLEFMRIVKADLSVGADGHSVSPSQYRILCRLQDGTATVSELAKWNAVTLPTATKILDVLDGRGWVERWRSHADRRMVNVGLTERGRRVQAELEERASRSLGAVLQSWEGGGLDTVEAAVSTMAAALAQRDEEAVPMLEDDQEVSGES